MGPARADWSGIPYLSAQSPRWKDGDLWVARHAEPHRVRESSAGTSRKCDMGNVTSAVCCLPTSFDPIAAAAVRCRALPRRPLRLVITKNVDSESAIGLSELQVC